MNYRARNLPAWVRFRAKPAQKPVYTVPTEWEWTVQEMNRSMFAAMAHRLTESITRNNALLALLEKRETDGPPRDGIRVRVAM